jgi:hypothetical protein
MIAIHLNAGNDRNGNPRRLFLILNEKATIVRAIDEGYEGTQALVPEFASVPVSQQIPTTYKEYRYLLKQFSKPRKVATLTGPHND